MEGKIVYQGKTAKGIDITIRYPNKDDAQAMCNYINTLSKEQTFITYQGEKVSLDEEIKYLNTQLERINKEKTVQLLVFCDNKLIGNSQLDLKDRTSKHEGVFGISIAQDFRGEGIGKTLMQSVLDEAGKNLPELRIVTLGLFENNSLAEEMYKKFGFQEYGRLPKGINHRGQYVDHIYMYKIIREPE